MKNKLYINTLLSIVLGTGIGATYNYNGIKGYNKVGNSELTSKKTVTKVFAPGTHIIEYSNVEMVGMPEMYEGYVDLDIDVPRGYELVDYEVSDRKMGPNDKYYNRGYYIFVNNEEVVVTGIYNEEEDKYLFSNPGKVVKTDKKVKTRKK